MCNVALSQEVLLSCGIQQAHCAGIPPLRGLHPRALPSVPPAGGCGLPGGPTQPLSLGTSPRPLITVASALAAEKSSRGPLLSWPS